MNTFEPCQFRQLFPLITTLASHSYNESNASSPLVYFDNGATTQKLQRVIDSQQYYYQQYNANVHRASHQLSTQATIAFEKSRTAVQHFIGAQHSHEIIWTKGATESINIVVQSLARNILQPGDEIVLSASEHHANIVPWQIVAEQTGAVIKVLPLTANGTINIGVLDDIITTQTKFVACAHISNVLGRINPIETIINKAKSVGAISVIDGAQAVAHVPIEVKKLDCDFYVFSAHKMYGPTGVGVLYGKQELLESMQPYQGGGEMIKTVSFTEGVTFNSLPFKFEAGTPNIAGVIAFAEAVSLVSTLVTLPQVDNKTDISYSDYEQQLTQYCYQALANIKEVTFIAQGIPDIGVISFTLTGHHNHDIATALDSYGIAIRSGHHCAMPLMESLQLTGCLRVSLAAYNTFSEIDYLIQCLTTLLAEDENRPATVKPIENESSTVSDLSSNAMNSLINLFGKAKGWDGRHREIMLLGKTLPRMDKTYRNDNSLITGCESLAWLKVAQNKDNTYHFMADSDAKIIRGLLVIVLAAYNDKTKEQIQAVNIQAYFNKLGLLQHLSPSRSNGLLAIVDKIKKLA